MNAARWTARALDLSRSGALIEGRGELQSAWERANWSRAKQAAKADARSGGLLRELMQETRRRIRAQLLERRTEKPSVFSRAGKFITKLFNRRSK